MGLHAHRVEELAADELEADDALVRVVSQVLLEQEEVVGQPDGRIAPEDVVHLRERFDDLDPRAASALVRLEHRGPSDVAGELVERCGIVEGDRARRIDAERPQQRRLDALAQLQREHVGAVEHAGAEELQRSHVRERQRDSPRVAAKIGAGAGLVEIEPGARRLVVVEGGAREVERRERDAASRQRLEQRLLPLGMLMEYRPGPRLPSS